MFALSHCRLSLCLCLSRFLATLYIQIAKLKSNAQGLCHRKGSGLLEKVPQFKDGLVCLPIWHRQKGQLICRAKRHQTFDLLVNRNFLFVVCQQITAQFFQSNSPSFTELKIVDRSSKKATEKTDTLTQSGTLKPIFVWRHLKLTVFFQAPCCRSSSTLVLHKKLLLFAPVECNFSSRRLLRPPAAFSGFPFLLGTCFPAVLFLRHLLLLLLLLPLLFPLLLLLQLSWLLLLLYSAISLIYCLVSCRSTLPQRVVVLVVMVLPLFTPVAVEIEFHLENIRAWLIT